MKSLAMYLDVYDLFNHYKKKIDYRGLLSHCQKSQEVIVRRAYGYNRTPNKEPFIKSLVYAGYDMIYMDSKTKGGWHSGLTFDVVSHVHTYEINIVLLGIVHPDYYPLVDKLIGMKHLQVLLLGTYPISGAQVMHIDDFLLKEPQNEIAKNSK